MPSSGDLPDPGIEPGLWHLLHWQAGLFCFFFFLPLVHLGSPHSLSISLKWEIHSDFPFLLKQNNCDMK